MVNGIPLYHEDFKPVSVSLSISLTETNIITLKDIEEGY